MVGKHKIFAGNIAIMPRSHGCYGSTRMHAAAGGTRCPQRVGKKSAFSQWILGRTANHERSSSASYAKATAGRGRSRSTGENSSTTKCGFLEIMFILSKIRCE